MFNRGAAKLTYKASFRRPASAKWQISVAGGTNPRWRRDGKEPYYISLDDTMMAVPVKSTAATFEPGAAVALFQTDTRGLFSLRCGCRWQVPDRHRDGGWDGRFLAYHGGAELDRGFTEVSLGTWAMDASAEAGIAAMSSTTSAHKVKIRPLRGPGWPGPHLAIFYQATVIAKLL